MASSFSFTKTLSEISEEGITFDYTLRKWDTAADVEDIVNALNTQKVVHFIKFDGNTLGVDAAAAIGKALEKHPEYCKALWNNMFGTRSKAEIPEALKHLGNGLTIAGAKLTVIDLNDNAIGPHGMPGIEDLLRSPVCFSLQELHMNNCGLGIYGARILAEALLDCDRNSKAAGTPLNLKVFIAGRNRLENGGAKAMAQIFGTLNTLEEIALPSNSIYHEGIAALSAGFKHNPHLKKLNLYDNTLTSKGASHLSEAFANLLHLREINIGDCMVKTNGAYLFAEALEKNHDELEIVDFSLNEIGPDAGIVLVGALQNKPNLKKLFLDGNQFGYEAREQIKDLMLNSPHPDALQEMEEDQSEAEEDEDEAGDEDQEEEETVDEEEEEIYDEHYNDTTEEADEDDYGENAAEETAYTTSQAFTTKMFNANDSFLSSKSSTFGNTTTNLNTTAETFCLSQKPCTLQMFESLTDNDKLQAFKNIIEQFSDDNYLLLLIFTALKCGHLAQTSAAALDLAMSLFQECIEYAVKTKQERRVLNYLLIQLGLMRCELKFKSCYDIKSCQYAVKETLNKKQLASEYMKNTLKVFLEQVGV